MKNQANVVIHKACHSRMSLSGIFHVLGRCSDLIKRNTLYNNAEAGDPRVPQTAISGMTTNFTATRGFTARSVIPTLRAAIYAGYSGHTGFTLIELLVVVLIIGILAAVAVPQYQKAVVKSRFVQLQIFGDAIVKSQNLYFLEHGNFATDFSTLPLTIHGKLKNSNRRLYAGPITCFFNSDEQIGCFYATSEKIDDLELLKSVAPSWHYYFTDSNQTTFCLGFTTIQKMVCKALSSQPNTPVAYGNAQFYAL